MSDTRTETNSQDSEIARLTAALADSNRRAETAESTAREAGRRLVDSEAFRLTAEESSADNRISSLESAISQMEADEADRQAEGKFREAGALRTKISLAASEIVNLRGYKTQVATAREAAARRPSDPVEAFIAGNNFSDAEKVWIRQNPRYASDEGFRSRINAAHNEAVGDKGLTRGSTEYFTYLAERGYQTQRQQQQRPEPARQAATEAGETGGGDAGNGESPFSDTGTEPDEGDGRPQVIIEEPQPAMPAQQRDGTPENPQPRAAGTSAGSSVAAAPTRRSVSGRSATAHQQIRMSPDEADMAFRFAQTVAPDVAAKGVAEVAVWWQEWRNSNRAKEIKQKWANGG